MSRLKSVVVAEMKLSRGLFNTIRSLASQLNLSEEDVLASSVKLLDGVTSGEYQVSKANGLAPARTEPEPTGG